MGADPQQTLRAFREAEAYDGPSLIIAYSHCIAHGIEMRDGLGQQYRAVASGYWPLVRYDPMLRTVGGNPFLLDSPRPRIALTDYTERELRYRSLSNTDPAEAERLGALAQEAVDQRWDTYEEMAARGAHRFPADARKESCWTFRPATWAWRYATRSSPPPHRCRTLSLVSGGWPTPVSARWCSTPCSRSNCAGRPRRTRG